MTRKDVAGLLALLQTEYPQSFGKLNGAQMQAKAKLWSDMLADYDGRVVMAAVKSLLSEAREFSPTIGEVQTRAREITAAQDMTEAEAWSLVSRACANGLYGYKEEYAKLPAEVQRAVGTPEQLREWAMVDIETLQTVVASNFMRSYKVAKKRESYMQSLPAEVRQMLTEATKRMALPKGV